MVRCKNHLCIKNKNQNYCRLEKPNLAIIRFTINHKFKFIPLEVDCKSKRERKQKN